MAKAKSRKRRTRAAAPTVVVREPAPRSQAIVIRETRAPARQSRRGGVVSSLFASGRRAGGGLIGALPVREAVTGGGAGAVSGLIDDLLPDSWATPKTAKRALLVFGVGALIARATGMPSIALAGLAGGVGRKWYDDATTT